MGQDILILLDSSKSMNEKFEGTESAESKIAIIKRGLKQYFTNPQGVYADDYIGLYTYRTVGLMRNTEVLIIFPLKPCTEHFDTLEIDKINALGDTPIGDAIKEAAESLPSVKGRASRIKLISDGNWNVGIDPLEVLEMIKKKNIKIDVLQVGKRANEQLLRRFSSETGGGNSQVMSTIDVEAGLRTNL